MEAVCSFKTLLSAYKSMKLPWAYLPPRDPEVSLREIVPKTKNKTLRPWIKKENCLPVLTYINLADFSRIEQETWGTRSFDAYVFGRVSLVGGLTRRTEDVYRTQPGL